MEKEFRKEANAVSTHSRQPLSNPGCRGDSVNYLGIATIIRTVEYHATLDSTNSYLKRLLAEPGRVAPEELPLLVIADQQTAGRGREGRSWWTGPGSLAFSLAIDLTRVPISEGQAIDLRPCSSQLGFAAGWAVAATIRDMFPTQTVYPWELASDPTLPPFPSPANIPGPPSPIAALGSLPSNIPPIFVSIKWPNDVMLNNRKVAGILVEIAEPRVAIVGVGVNTNCSIEEAPPEIRTRAASIRDLTAQSSDHRRFLASWARHFAAVLARLAEDPTAASYLVSTLCTHVGQTLTVQSGEQTFSGLCRGISRDGALILEIDGQIRHLYSGHILT